MNDTRRTRLDFEADLKVTRTDNPPEPEVAESEFVDELMAYLGLETPQRGYST